MRFLGIGDYNDLGDMYLRLMAAGHEVRVHVADPKRRDTLGGFLTLVDEWQSQLDWVSAAGRDGIILFENVNAGHIQDRLRQAGFAVVGGSREGDRLENDRAYGQAILRALQVQTAATYEFSDFDDAIAFVQSHPGRYVFKLNGTGHRSGDNYVAELDDGADLIAWLETSQRRWDRPAAPHFVLMEHLSGIEIGVGAYFDGTDFLQPACLDWEHKRFCNGDLGELTGEMGTLVTYRGAERLFAATLGRLKERLRHAGHCGYININTIVNEDGIWPLEFTCRFGYPGFSILDSLHAEEWDKILYRMAHQGGGTLSTHSGYGIGVVLTVPPFPYQSGYQEMSKGLPIMFRGELTANDRRNVHYCEVAMKDGRLVTSGVAGQLMIVTGRGDTVEAAQAEAYALARRVVVPNLRYRTDIGDSFLQRDCARLQRLGILEMLPPSP